MKFVADGVGGGSCHNRTRLILQYSSLPVLLSRPPRCSHMFVYEYHGWVWLSMRMLSVIATDHSV